MLQGQFNGGKMVMLQRWPFQWRENGHFTEVLTLEGEWSCYGCGQFKGGRMVMLWSLSL